MFKKRIRDWGIWRTIGMTAGGDNKTGEVIHGVLDWLPIPNQPIGKIIKAVTMGNKEKAQEELKKLLSVRNVIALAFSVPVVLGWITIEDIQRWVEAAMSVLNVISPLLNGMDV